MIEIETPSDPEVPALGLLLGPDAAGLLEAVMEQAGGRVRSHSVSQVRYRPGRSVTAQYRADVQWGDQRPTREMLVATSGIDLPADTPVFSAGGVEIGVWRFPNDPFLPGLATAADPEQAPALVAQLGAPAEVTGVRTRAYRAGRRAVVELTTPAGTVFVKIVRPERAATLQLKHSLLSPHVPVPLSYGWSEQHGIVALQALGGRTLRKSLEARSQRLPGAAAIVDLLDRIPGEGLEGHPVTGSRDRAAEHRRLLSAVCPELTGRLDALVDRLATRDGSAGDQPVHGDFHSSQLLTDGEAVVGLVDVDTAGIGSRVDDLASLLGQLATLALTSSASAGIERYGAELITAFDRMVDPAELRLRTAAVVLGLATGPFRVQLPRWPAETKRRIDLAERWVQSADRAI